MKYGLKTIAPWCEVRTVNHMSETSPDEREWKSIRKTRVFNFSIVVDYDVDKYERVWKTSYSDLMDCLDIDVEIQVEGKITKWQKGEGYGVVIDAEVVNLV